MLEMVLTQSGWILVIFVVTFSSFSFCRVFGRRPGMLVYFWVVNFRSGDTDADLETLDSWFEDNRRILR